MDEPHVYVRAWALGCFYSHISTRTFRKALTASVHSYAEIKSAPSVAYVTKSGRVWRKVPESDVRSVISTRTFRRALTASVDSCAELKSAPSVAYVTKSGRVWRKVPKSDACWEYATSHYTTTTSVF